MPFPVINSVEIFPTYGGPVTITGENFQNPVLNNVLIDGNPLDPEILFINSDSELVINPVPVNLPGPHNFRIENEDGFWELVIIYSYYPLQYEDLYDTVNPDNGDTGDTVTIFRLGFTGATAVKFGATNATSFTVLDDEIIEAVVPALAAGTYDVIVTTLGGDVTFVNAFAHAGDGGGDGGGESVTTVDNLLYPIITFKVNILPLASSPNVDLIGRRDVLDHRNKQASIMIPGVSGTLRNADTFVLKGIDAVKVRNLYSTKIIGDYFSQPLIVIEEVI